MRKTKILYFSLAVTAIIVTLKAHNLRSIGEC